MTKRERVLAAMDNRPVDRPPVGFWFHFKAEESHGEPSVNAHLRYYNHVNVDIAKLMCDGYFDYPHPVAKAARETDDWYRLTPLGPDSAYIREQVERAKAVKAGLQSDCVVLYNVFAPFSTLRFGVSDELVMRHLREDPQSILYALDIVAQDNALLSELLLTEAGVDGIYYCLQGGEKDRFTTEEYQKYIAPSDLKVLTRANQFGDMNVLHCCGWAGIPTNMENWRDYPAKAVNWACFIEDMNLTQGKAFFGGRCVLGGFDNRKESLMVTGDKPGIQAYAKNLVKETASAGIMLGADCTLPNTMDVAHIQWVVDAVDELK
jgi:uroporphyrinogen decarboxylase